MKTARTKYPRRPKFPAGVLLLRPVETETDLLARKVTPVAPLLLQVELDTVVLLLPFQQHTVVADRRHVPVNRTVFAAPQIAVKQFQFLGHVPQRSEAAGVRHNQVVQRRIDRISLVVVADERIVQVGHLAGQQRLVEHEIHPPAANNSASTVEPCSATRSRARLNCV